MATFGRVATPDAHTEKMIVESLSEREQLKMDMRKIYDQIKELQKRSSLIETQYKGLESQARCSVMLYEGDTGMLMVSVDNRICRVKDAGSKLEMFSANEVKEGTTGSMTFLPCAQTKKAGHKEPITVDKGAPLKVYHYTMNDARLWWADGGARGE